MCSSPESCRLEGRGTSAKAIPLLAKPPPPPELRRSRLIRRAAAQKQHFRVYLRFTGSPFILRFAASSTQTEEFFAYLGLPVTANSMLSARLPEVDQSVSIETLLGVAAQATDILNQIRDAMLEPYPRKSAPTFTSAQVASLCGLDKQRFQYLTTKGDLPPGTSKGAGRSKEFTLAGSAHMGPGDERARRSGPKGKRGRIVTVANFKGGVAKTTTAVSAAQALTLLGRKVLVIDCDPQGTTTQFAGGRPTPKSRTTRPFFRSSTATSKPCIMPSRKRTGITWT